MPAAPPTLGAMWGLRAVRRTVLRVVSWLTPATLRCPVCGMGVNAVEHREGAVLFVPCGHEVT